MRIMYFGSFDAKAIPVNQKGLYFLFGSEGLLYIGKSNNIKRRLRDHLNGNYKSNRQPHINPKEIKEIRVVPEWYDYETFMIRLLTPKWNIVENCSFKIGKPFCYDCCSFHKPGECDEEVKDFVKIQLAKAKELLE